MEREENINENAMLAGTLQVIPTSSSHSSEDEVTAVRGVLQSLQGLHLYPINKIRLLVSYVTLLGRLVIPVFIAAYSAWLRNQRTVVDGLRKLCVPGIIAVVAGSVSLSALSRAIAIPCGKIDPLLRTFRVIKTKSGRLLQPKALVAGNVESDVEPEKSVKCDVLHDPGVDRIRADVIFIHGLHGSLEKTWKQGLWDAAHGRHVPLKRNNSCYSVSKRGNPAMLSLRKQTTFIHTDTVLHNILNQSENKKDASPKLESEVNSDRVSLIGDFTSSDIDACREAMAAKVDDIINGEEATARENENSQATTATTESYTPCWPRDWLPIDCPGVRVIALNYSTDPFLWRPLWVTKRIRTAMLERGREMMDQLQQLGVGNNPIVWVGHSKGGLFIKQMIVDAYESGNQLWSGLCYNTRGIMFYSVPHRGSPCADINFPLLRQSVEVTEVQKDCREVLELHEKFLSLINSKVLRAEVFSFIETIQTFMAVLYIQIVSLETADPGIGKISGVPVDHRNICKPTSRQCFLYKELINLINQNV